MTTAVASPPRSLLGRIFVAPFLLLLGLVGCRSYPPITTEANVDLGRFAGSWYVIASIPTSLEEGAHNAVETYSEPKDGVIDIHFRFNRDAFDGPEKVLEMTGYVSDESNSVWGVQLYWPFRLEYRILQLDESAGITVIGRTKRDYVWIMARQPSIPDARYQEIVEFLEREGYDVTKVERVPQAAAE